MTLRIVADENMPNVEAWFSSVATEITRLPGRQMTRADLLEADVLLVRSVTRVDEALLNGTPVSFVGSATIGTDHVDQDYLSQQNIPFHYAPGCNAASVADWLLSVLSRLHLDHDLHWWDKTIGIVGVGNVGSAVRATLEAHGCRLLLCDPPRFERGELPEHTPLATLMSNADIVCFHTPHTRHGEHATEGLVSSAMVSRMRPVSWLINAGRGPVFTAEAVERATQTQQVGVVLDVWPQEPQVSESLLDCAALASPHVAGYSLEGKFRGTEMLARALQAQHGWSSLVGPVLPPGPRLDPELYRQSDLHRWVSELILAVYDPARDTVAMKASVTDGEVSPERFDQLRKEYPTRREIRSVRLSAYPADIIDRLRACGFQVPD
ncbi:4-phosphoerythronate dehydrogenase [Reinekea blandensis]|uniref:Erythronate-4-phosphate dehydrogenase n=1 Tax=Reinekea blandensis MED297 TaxID=314283 RepID=A4BI00_9GAMM|nr:4-phosphoerythronate dehydrogenase [Reinekea blandensis]EAR08272.1 erythronate-4-phosphate dehydrogenase [Reinekea sp. MED297] [Reinekea blandensis MED297]